MDHCKEHGVESVKTGAGLFYRTTKTKYWTNDWEQMHEFILEHKVPELLERRVSQKEVVELEPYVEIEDVAKHLRVSVSTVRAWLRQSKIPNNTYVKIGKTYRFKLSAVDSALLNSATDRAPDTMDFDAIADVMSEFEDQ